MYLFCLCGTPCRGLLQGHSDDEERKVFEVVALRNPLKDPLGLVIVLAGAVSESRFLLEPAALPSNIAVASKTETHQGQETTGLCSGGGGLQATDDAPSVALTEYVCFESFCRTLCFRSSTSVAIVT